MDLLIININDYCYNLQSVNDMTTQCYVHCLIHHCSAIGSHITFPLKQHKVESK